MFTLRGEQDPTGAIGDVGFVGETLGVNFMNAQHAGPRQDRV